MTNITISINELSRIYAVPLREALKENKELKAENERLLSRVEQLKKAIEDGRNWILLHECHYGISLSCLDEILKKALGEASSQEGSKKALEPTKTP